MTPKTAPVERTCSSIRLPADLHERVMAEAQLRDRSLSKFVTLVLRDWIAAHGSQR